MAHGMRRPYPRDRSPITETDGRPYLTVIWCFFHARREWSDESCGLVRRFTLPNGRPLEIGAAEQRVA